MNDNINDETNLNNECVLSNPLSNDEYGDDEWEGEEEEMEEDEPADPDLHEFTIGRQKVMVKLKDFVSVDLHVFILNVFD